MKKIKWRFIRCIWHDKVDLMIWLLTGAGFVYSQFGNDVSGGLFLLFGYIYYMMYRKVTFWQDRAKMYAELRKYLVDVDEVISREDL